MIARLLAAAENAGLVAALAVMALLPLAEIALRAAFQVGVSGAAAFTQNLALVAGMFGAVVAAREGRLLSLSALPELLSPAAATRARQFTGIVSAAITALLFVASVEFVCAERSGGNVIAYGVPIWLMAAALPAGFALMTLRLAGAAPSWQGRVAAIAAAVMVGLAAASGLALNGTLVVALLGLLLLSAVLGSPVFTTLGGAALILFWADGLPIASMTLDHYRLVVNPSLPMIPLFTLAGYFLAEGGAPRRLVRVCDALFGGLRGGAALVAVIACVFFTSFSGASGVTIIALGGMLMPLLLGSGYSPKTALGLLTSAGSLGGLLPPGLPLVLYAIVAKVSIQDMFLAGILPGLLMIALVAIWGWRQAPRQTTTRRRFDAREARAALWDAKWELALPIVAFAGLFSGRATPVEAAALTAVYALVIEVLIHRELDLRRDVPRVMVQAGLLVGGILLILGVALGLTNYLVDARIPERAVDWVTGSVPSRVVFLLLLNLFLLVAGCFLDIFSATVVLVPILLPLASAYGIDPVHLGIIFLANMELGYLTPPVGMNLFFAAYRFGKPLPEVFRAVLAPACVLAAGVLLITFLPWLTTALLKGGSL